MNRIWKFALLIVGIILVDQFSKGIIQSNFTVGQSITVIPSFFSITYVRNPGAAFGFLANAPSSIRTPLFLFLPVAVCVWLCVLIWKSKTGPILTGLAYSLIFAGAVGNLIDRFALGYVVDYLDFYADVHHFPAFNVADSSISIAAGLLIIDLLLNLKNKKA